MVVDLWVMKGHVADSVPPCWEDVRSALVCRPLWEAFCNLSVSRFILLRGRFLTSARGDRGGIKTTGKEKGNMKLGDWAVIGLKRWTLADHVGEVKWNMNVHNSSPASTFGFCYFQYFFDTSPCLHLSLRFSPSRSIQFVCLWKKKLKQRAEGKQGIQEGG